MEDSNGFDPDNLDRESVLPQPFSSKAMRTLQVSEALPENQAKGLRAGLLLTAVYHVVDAGLFALAVIAVKLGFPRLSRAMNELIPQLAARFQSAMKREAENLDGVDMDDLGDGEIPDDWGPGAGP